MPKPKKDKTKVAEKRARTEAKQTKKAAQKEKKSKVKGKGKDEDSDAEDVDLEAVLKEYAEQQAQFLKVTEESCEPPSARASSTLVGSPSNSNELFLFGGEYFNGALATFHSDLFVYQINRAEWRRVTSPNSPLPRSGHAWTRGGNAGGLWLFGGEFSSPKQGTFYHYNDFWKLEPASREWTRVESKKGPPARSGHRMTYFKQYIVLFGGFQDTSQQTKYLQDLWLYDTANYVWHNPALPPASQKPDARSSFSFLPHDLGAVLHGGYSRVKTNEKAGRSKGGGQTMRTVLQPMVHQDTWFLKITPPGPDAPPSAPPLVRWERRKRPANAPNPARAGATMAYHKSRGVSFGGVHDVENSEEGIESEFFDTLFAWNIDRNRFFQLALRKPRGPSKKQQALADRGGRRGRGKADEEELLRNLAALESKGSIEDSDAMDVDKPEDEPMAETPEQPLLDTMPHPRFNAQLAVQDDVLYIYGGTYEAGDREFTFDEMYAIDLGKLDGVKQIFHRELENWQGSDDEDSDGDEDEDEDEDEDDEEDEDGGEEAPQTPAVGDDEMDSVGTAAAETETMSEATLVDEEQQVSAQSDSRPFPRPFESLREFYSRTSTDWQALLLEELRIEDASANSSSIKELRKEAFTFAETRWWDCREEVMALEDQQEEAGIGEVVSIADKAQAGGAGRRR